MSVVVVRGRVRGAVALGGFSGTVAQAVVLELLGAGELHGVRPKPFARWWWGAGLCWMGRRWGRGRRWSFGWGLR